jgi:hypothetical protein
MEIGVLASEFQYGRVSLIAPPEDIAFLSFIVTVEMDIYPTSVLSVEITKPTITYEY